MNYYLLKMNEQAEEPYQLISGYGPAKDVYQQHLAVKDISSENVIGVRQCGKIKHIAIETEDFKVKRDSNGKTSIRNHLLNGGAALFEYENREYYGRATFFEAPVIVGENEYGEIEEIGSFTINIGDNYKTFPLESLDEELIVDNVHAHLIKFAAILYD